MQSDYALAAGQQKAADQGLKNADREASIKTAMAANGVDVNTGSNASVQTSQKMIDNLDVNRILQDAGVTAWGYKNQAKQFENEQGMDVLKGITGAGATLLEGAPKFNFKVGSGNSGSWDQARKNVFA